MPWRPTSAPAAPRTPSGIWKLAVFHAGVQFYFGGGLDRESGCQYRKAPAIRQWAALDPAQPGPVITNAALLVDQAWCIRGTGFAPSVPDRAWPDFRNTIDAAFKQLETRRDIASVDPEFYAVMATIYRVQGRSAGEFHQLIVEATDREPYYHRTYFKAAWYYLPQWDGSFEQVDEFARFAAERTRASEKSGFYARVYWSLEECGCDIIAKASDWPRMKQAMRDVYDRYPVRWNGEYFGNLSCKMGDGEEGRRYIRATTAGATGDADLAAYFAACDGMRRPAA